MRGGGGGVRVFWLKLLHPIFFVRFLRRNADSSPDTWKIVAFGTPCICQLSVSSRSFSSIETSPDRPGKLRGPAGSKESVWLFSVKWFRTLGPVFSVFLPTHSTTVIPSHVFRSSVSPVYETLANASRPRFTRVHNIVRYVAVVCMETSADPLVWTSFLSELIETRYTRPGKRLLVFHSLGRKPLRHHARVSRQFIKGPPWNQ